MINTYLSFLVSVCSGFEYLCVSISSILGHSSTDYGFFLGLDGMMPLLTQNRHTGLRRMRLRPCKFIVLAPLVTALLSSVSSSPSSGKAKAKKTKLIAAVPEHSLSEAVGPFPDYASFERALGNLIGGYG